MIIFKNDLLSTRTQAPYLGKHIYPILQKEHHRSHRLKLSYYLEILKNRKRIMTANESPEKINAKRPNGSKVLCLWKNPMIRKDLKNGCSPDSFYEFRTKPRFISECRKMIEDENYQSSFFVDLGSFVSSLKKKKKKNKGNHTAKDGITPHRATWMHTNNDDSKEEKSKRSRKDQKAKPTSLVELKHNDSHSESQSSSEQTQLQYHEILEVCADGVKTVIIDCWHQGTNESFDD